MPRTARASQGGYCYHVLNRGNGRRTVFHKDGDFAAFVKLLREAGERTPVRLLAYCLMPNHFHLALWPHEDGDSSDYMMWLLTAHVRRYHQHYHSSGHVWQGRFRAFPIQEDEHLLTRTPLHRTQSRARRPGRTRPGLALVQCRAGSGGGPALDPGPVPRPADWLAARQRAADRSRGGTSARVPASPPSLWDAGWMEETARQLGLEASLRPRGRPRKQKPAPDGASLFDHSEDAD